jgi:hypothetical protein
MPITSNNLFPSSPTRIGSVTPMNSSSVYQYDSSALYSVNISNSVGQELIMAGSCQAQNGGS